MTFDTITDEMQSLYETGFTAGRAITDRAVCMRSHAERGNHERSEEYAREIMQLQAFEARRNGSTHSPDRTGKEEWRINNYRWADNIIGGGWMCGREFWPAMGCTEDQALAEAVRVFLKPQGIHEISPAFRRVPTFAGSGDYSMAAE